MTKPDGYAIGKHERLWRPISEEGRAKDATFLRVGEKTRQSAACRGDS
jgi:hypothetical protein